MPRPTPHADARGRTVPGAVARVLLLVLVVLGFGLVASRSDAAPEPEPPRGDVAAAHRAIAALLDPGPTPDALALLPTDFTAVTGVVPGALPAPDGTVRAVHLDGGCSAPWGEDNTRWGFGTLCRAHDLGYDLLRYAEKKNQPLGPEVRKALDARLSEDMHATCRVNPRDSRALCDSVATVYSAGLVVNSWHQRWGPPVGEPIAPLFAGVTAIGFLLSHRLRGRLLAGRPRREDPQPQRPRRARLAGWRSKPAPGGLWTLVGVGSVVVLMSGEAAVALARWAGADQGLLWPVTWLAQTTVVFFFAAGHANAANWLAVSRSGGGFREFLAHRGSWLLRFTLVFAVVAFAVPIALELLRVPRGTIDAVVRIALHPLWLLGLYLLTVVSTPLALALHRRAPLATPAVLIVLLASAEWLTGHTPSALPHHVAALLVALLAQQLAFAHRDGLRPNRRWLLFGTVTGTAALAAGVAVDAWPSNVLGVAEASPALAGPPTAVLLVGVVHLGVLGVSRTYLARFGERRPVLRAAGLASRAPMSLYLLFLAATLMLVAGVYLPARFGADLGWLLRPRALLAVALLAGPAVLVFAWYERHVWQRPPPLPVRHVHGVGLDRMLAHAATVAGFGFAVLGVFGFALTTLDAEIVPLAGLLLDPVQSLVHLLLGMSLLHSVRTGASHTPGTWTLMALACVPPLLSVTTAASPDALGLVVHLTAGGLGLVAALTTLTTRRSPDRRFSG